MFTFMSSFVLDYPLFCNPPCVFSEVIQGLCDYCSGSIAKGSILFVINEIKTYLFIWGFTLLSTLYRSYHDG